MNRNTCKLISRKTEEILTHWLLSLIAEEKEIKYKDVYKYLPKQEYYYNIKTLYLSTYSKKWVRKNLKKMYKAGVDIASIDYDYFNNNYKDYST